MRERLNNLAKQWVETTKKQLKDAAFRLIKNGICYSLIDKVDEYFIKRPIKKIIELCELYDLDKSEFVPGYADYAKSK